MKGLIFCFSVFLFSFQVQEFLCSLEEEDLEVLKKDLIAIKEIFISREEEEEPEATSGENGDLYSQIQCSTPLCESSNAKTWVKATSHFGVIKSCTQSKSCAWWSEL